MTSNRVLLAAFVAVLISSTLADTAQAYPLTATAGRTTVTGTYRPLDMDLTMDSGELFYDSDPYAWNPFSITGSFSGTFEGVGYTASGQAGTWNLEISPRDPLGWMRNMMLDVTGNTFTLYAENDNTLVGTLAYGGGFSVVSGSVPPEDTPKEEEADLAHPPFTISGDIFELYAPSAGAVLQVIVDDIANPTTMELILLQDLRHIGPMREIGWSETRNLDGQRVNVECVVDPNASNLTYKPCGDAKLTMTVPEPATLALLGIGLFGLSLGRRANS